MVDTSYFPDAIDLRPVGMYDTGREVLRPDVDSAVGSMLATGCEIHVYEKRTLMALYKNVSRRNAKRAEGSPELRLWTHRTPDPTGVYEGRWMIRLRQEQDLINPFFSADQESQYGRWLPLAEQLILGQDVRVKNTGEVVRLGQSFRFACDKRGFLREGRMLRRRKEGREWVVSVAKPLVKKDDVAAETSEPKSPAKPKRGRSKTPSVREAKPRAKKAVAKGKSKPKTRTKGK